MSDIVKSAPFCFVIDHDFNTEWIDICELTSVDQLYDLCPLRDQHGNIDGCLGGRLYFDQDCGCGNGRYITGADWYGFQETIKGVNYFQTNTEEDVSEERYKKIVKVRGMNVPESVICQFNKDLKVA